MARNKRYEGLNTDPDAPVTTSPAPSTAQVAETTPTEDLEKVGKEEKSTYRVLTKNAIIDGKKYEEPDEEGGYGTVELTETYARQLMAHGVGMIEVEDDDGAC